MIKRNNKKLKIGFMSPTIGCFGAIREMVEVSNELVGKGHRVYIYHPDGGECRWLTCLAECRKLSFLFRDTLDVLIGIVDWQPELYQDLLSAQAKVKAICLLGFHPTEQMAQALRGEVEPLDKAQKMIRDAMQRKFLILADSAWQVEWVKKNTGYPAGPSFGGINLNMFSPPKQKIKKEKIKIIYSGDPRERKGTDIVEKAIFDIKSNYSRPENLEFDFYWGKKFPQKKLVEFIQSGDIFLDAHRRAGWCNPVAEAMACGVVPVCTAIGANAEFALDNVTSLRVPMDDAKAMAEQTVRLLEDEEFRKKLRENGLKHIQKFSYRNIVPVLEKVLENKVYG